MMVHSIMYPRRNRGKPKPPAVITTLAYYSHQQTPTFLFLRKGEPRLLLLRRPLWMAGEESVSDEYLVSHNQTKDQADQT